MGVKKKDFTEEFLTEFRRVEQLIQQIYGPNMTFRDMEQRLEEQGEQVLSKKMQLCRNIRNYASHNVDISSFLPVPEELCLFMKSLYAEFEREITTVKDTMSRTKALSIRDNVAYGASRLAKLPAVPVVDDDGIMIGIFDYDVLRRCVADELSHKARFGKGVIKLTAVPKHVCVTSSAPMEEVNKIFCDYNTQIVYVTDNGKPDGKYLGTVVKSHV